MSYNVKFNGNSRARVAAVYNESSQYKSPDHDYRGNEGEFNSGSESTSAHSSFNNSLSPNSGKSASPSGNMFNDKPISNAQGRSPNSNKPFFDKQSSNGYGFSGTEKGICGSSFRRESNDSGTGSNSPTGKNGIDGPWEHDLFEALEGIVPSRKQPKIPSRGPTPSEEKPMAPVNNGQATGRVVRCNLVPADLMFLLRVNKLPLNVVEEDLQAMFKNFNYTRLRMYKDHQGRFNGNADVFFCRLPDAQRALKHYTGAYLDQQKIELELKKSCAEDLEDLPASSTDMSKKNCEGNQMWNQGNRGNENNHGGFARHSPPYRHEEHRNNYNYQERFPDGNQQNNFHRQSFNQNQRNNIWNSGRVNRGPANDRQRNFSGDDFNRRPPSVASHYNDYSENYFERRPTVSPVSQNYGNFQERPKKELPNLFTKAAMQKAQNESNFFSIRELTPEEKNKIMTRDNWE